MQLVRQVEQIQDWTFFQVLRGHHWQTESACARAIELAADNLAHAATEHAEFLENLRQGAQGAHINVAQLIDTLNAAGKEGGG